MYNLLQSCTQVRSLFVVLLTPKLKYIDLRGCWNKNSVIFPGRENSQKLALFEKELDEMMKWRPNLIVLRGDKAQSVLLGGLDDIKAEVTEHILNLWNGHLDRHF